MADHHHDHGAHVHAHAGARLASRLTRRALGATVLVIALLAVVGAVLLWPDADRPVLAEELGFTGELVNAEVTRVQVVPCAGTELEDGIPCDRVRIHLTDGPTAGEDGSFEIPSIEAAVDLREGDAIVVHYVPNNDPQFRYYFQDYQRERPLLLLAALFAIAVVVLGRWQGVRALLALGLTGVVMVAFAFPSILDGHDPVAVALVTAVVVAVAALYLTHGVTDMITVALLGTFAALAITAVLGAIFGQMAHFTGYGSEDAFSLRFASADIDVRGLVLAGIIVGSLGVLDDVTVTQASAVWQLQEANPAASVGQLYRHAITIGRDHIASTVNTLVLAYAGASLPLLLLFAQAGRSLGEVAVGELVAVEIVRTLVGSIGLVTAVPVTTALAAVVVHRGTIPEPVEAEPSLE